MRAVVDMTVCAPEQDGRVARDATTRIRERRKKNMRAVATPGVAGTRSTLTAQEVADAIRSQGVACDDKTVRAAERKFHDLLRAEVFEVWPELYWAMALEGDAA